MFSIPDRNIDIVQFGSIQLPEDKVKNDNHYEYFLTFY